MKNTFSKDLFERYIAGTCNESEQAMVEAWYLSQLQQHEGRPSPEQLRAAKEDIWKGIQPTRGIRPLIRWASAVAAVLLAVLFVYKLQNKTGLEQIGDKKQSALQTEVAKKDLVETATVLVASKIENSMMKLPDGTTVILAKGSKLTLLPAFNKKYNREVELEGKAFFDVVHNREKPFIIYTGTVRTTVLGTAFDVTAMQGSKSIKVNVIRGLVEVRDLKSRWVTILPKNFQVLFDEVHTVPQRRPVDAEKELSWNKKDLEFKDIAIEDAKPRFEEQFGYKIVINDPQLRNQTFNYSMRSSESMESFIKSISDFIGASYTIDNKNKIISIQPLNQ